MIDFHCHLDLYPDPVDAARRADLTRFYVLSVTTTPKAWQRTLGLAKGCTRIRTALGLHPQIAHERVGELPLFEALLPETSYVGEIGLDGSPDCRRYAADQRHVFEAVLRMCADRGGRVLSIHSRAAADQVLECLRAEPGAGTPVLHWFSGSMRQLRRAVDQGCWFSVGLPMTRTERGRAILAALPRTRVLTETDGPFVENHGRAMMPGDVPLAIASLAEIWGKPTNEVQNQLMSNFRDLTSSVVMR